MTYSTNPEENVAYFRGQKAFKEKHSERFNPFPYKTNLYESWLDGYYDAKNKEHK
jgi:hypothetical protein